MWDMSRRVREIQNDLKTLLLDQAVIKEDLRHHIRRTDTLEDQVVPLIKKFSYLDSAMKLLGVLAIVSTIVGVWYKIIQP